MLIHLMLIVDFLAKIEARWLTDFKSRALHRPITLVQAQPSLAQHWSIIL